MGLSIILFLHWGAFGKEEHSLKQFTGEKCPHIVLVGMKSGIDCNAMCDHESKIVELYNFLLPGNSTFGSLY